MVAENGALSREVTCSLSGAAGSKNFESGEAHSHENAA
jgi:hypothetical protein